MTDTLNTRIDVVLICGGEWHDIDFARSELLKLLAEDERIRTRVFENYDNAHAALSDAEIHVTFTSNVVASLETQQVLRTFVEQGGRWFALHGTNSFVRFLSPEGADYGSLLVDAPRWAPLMMETLGSQFIAHPPIGPYKVEVGQPDHPLVTDIEPFETTDELYLLETHGDLEVLLYTEFEGEAPGFVEDKWPKQKHPILYLQTVGEGKILYFTLGHCRGHYDMVGITDYYPEVERCSWELPVFYKILRRGIAWASDPALTKARETAVAE